ncbi:hypothetical protein [Caballeronia hypogeia]|uniref:hypothetical protein n=1 Tax=Caballeronia hypogeia TaxID=1777140 RepID=UPI000A5B9221|nr:hypothetical protein [Caballeronia hypogeia]
MTPIETQHAMRAVRTPTTPQSPAGWRAYVHLRRAWLAAAAWPGRRVRNPGERLGPHRRIGDSPHKDRRENAVIPFESTLCTPKTA